MDQAPRRRSNAGNIALLLLNGLGLLFGLMAGVGLLVAGLVNLNGSSSPTADGTPLISLAFSAGLVCVLLIPGLVHAIKQLFGKDTPVWQLHDPLRIATLLLIPWGLLLVAGGFLSRANGLLPTLLLSFVQIFVVAIPLWWLVEAAKHNLQIGPAARGWGVLSFGLLVTPLVILVVEALVLVGVGLLGLLYLSSQPQLVEQITRLIQRIATSQMDPTVLTRVLSPYLQNPLLILAGLAVGAALIPLLEELLKPLGVWLLVGRGLTPSEGFSYGMISGAAFALLESLGYLATPLGSDWLSVVIGRMGTGILHVTTAGLTGWALACAWSQRRYLRLVLAYLFAVLLHAVWNSFGLLMGVGTLLSSADNPVAAAAVTLSKIAPYALAILAASMLVGLLNFKRRLAEGSTQPETPPNLTPSGDL